MPTPEKKITSNMRQLLISLHIEQFCLLKIDSPCDLFFDVRSNDYVSVCLQKIHKEKRERERGRERERERDVFCREKSI